MFAYKYLLQAIPRAGGEYVYVSRVISPVLGAMVGIGIAVAFTYILAANAQFTATFMPFALTGLGDAFSQLVDRRGREPRHQQDCDRADLRRHDARSSACSRCCRCGGSRRSSSASSSSSSSRSSRSASSSWPTRHSDFVSSFGSFSHNSNAYNAVLTTAKQNGVVTGISLTASLLVVPFMVLNYNGVLYSYYVGGELKRPGRTYMYASIISIALLVVVWVGIWVLLRWRVGLDFMQAQANLNAVQRRRVRQHHEPVRPGRRPRLRPRPVGRPDHEDPVLDRRAVRGARGRPGVRRGHHPRAVRARVRPDAAGVGREGERAHRTARSIATDHRPRRRHRVLDPGHLRRPSRTSSPTWRCSSR